MRLPRLYEIFSTIGKAEGLSDYVAFLNSVEQASKNVEPTASDLLIARHLIDWTAVLIAHEADAADASRFGASKLWSHQLQNFHADILVPLKSGNVERLALSLCNLYRSLSSNGMSYPDIQTITQGKFYANTYAKMRAVRMLRSYKRKLASSLATNLPAGALSSISNGYGNPILVKIEKKICSFEAIYHLLILSDLNRLIGGIDNIEERGVADLGSGLGVLLSLIYVLFRRKCYFIDLSENLILAAYFANKYAPKAKKYYYGQGDYSAAYDMYFIPSFAVASIPEGAVNLFINTFSFPEMERDIALNYLNTIHSKLPESGKIFSINRYEDISNKKRGGICHDRNENSDPSCRLFQQNWRDCHAEFLQYA